MLEPIYNKLHYDRKEEKLRTLIRINCVIWDYEEEVRRSMKWDIFNRKLAKIAKGIAIANDERCAIKKVINMDCGYEHQEEKSHTP